MKTEVKSDKSKKTPKARTTKKNNKKTYKKKKKNNKVIVIIAFCIVLIIIGLLILFSDLFNITQIIVINNLKVPTQEIIQDSKLIVGNNMFKTFKTNIKNDIKMNPYIEEVKVTKKLNGEVIIDIKERTSTFMLLTDSGYAYINNQGYILEISEIPLQLPIIKGYVTKEITPGLRLDINDLKKLDVVIQIMETAKNNGIKNIIEAIDISNSNNFVLEIPSEKKTVQFGDETNINVKILWIVDLIKREKGIEGEIILNVPNIKKIYFREKV